MRFAHRKFPLTCIALIAFCSAHAHAAVDTESLRAAAEAYKSGKPADALAIYEKSIADSGASGAQLAALLFNAGNAAFQAGKAGLAVAYYSQAARLAPFDSDIAHNRRLAEAKLGRSDRAEAPLPRALASDFFHDTPPDIWLALALTCSLAAFVVWLVSRKALRAAPLFALAFFSALLFSAAIYAISVKNGIVISDETIVRSGPGDSFPEITRIGQGSTVEVRETQSGWYKVAFEFRQKRVVGWAGAIAVRRLGE